MVRAFVSFSLINFSDPWQDSFRTSSANPARTIGDGRPSCAIFRCHLKGSFSPSLFVPWILSKNALLFRFPFNILLDPMYVGSALCFAATALWWVGLNIIMHLTHLLGTRNHDAICVHSLHLPLKGMFFMNHDSQVELDLIQFLQPLRRHDLRYAWSRKGQSEGYKDPSRQPLIRVIYAFTRMLRSFFSVVQRLSFYTKCQDL